MSLLWKHRYWTMTSGLLTSFLTGRFITIKCRTCDKTVLWDQS